MFVSRMRIVIVGMGEVGQSLARILSQEHQEVTLVDRDPARVELVGGQLDALALAGNGASPHFLEDHQLGDADLFLAVTSNDEANLLACTAAKQMGARRTVARVSDSDYFGSRASMASDVLGIDLVVHPAKITAQEIAEAVLLPGAVNVEYFAGGELAVAEVIVSDASPLVGRAISQRPVTRPHYIMGLIRKGTARPALGSDILRSGDRILVSANAKDLRHVAAELAGDARPVREAVLLGGGRVGVELARTLAASRIRVRLLERDERRARQAAEMLPEVEVLHEDGVSNEALLSAGVDTADCFITCTADDRTNMLAAVHAKHLGVPLTFSLITREEFVPLASSLPIDMGFAPRLITAQAISRYLHEDNVHTIYLLIGGAELIEMEVKDGSRMQGASTGRGGLQEHCRIGTILRDGKIVIPRESETLRTGDRVLVFAEDGFERQVEDAFSC